MNTGIELLFLRGHLINVDLARSLAAAEPTASAPTERPGSCELLPTPIAHGDLADAVPPAADAGAIAPEPARNRPPILGLSWAFAADGEHAGEGYRRGYGNRVANERALRPRWQRGPAGAASKPKVPSCLSACACG